MEHSIPPSAKRDTGTGSEKGSGVMTLTTIVNRVLKALNSKKRIKKSKILVIGEQGLSDEFLRLLAKRMVEGLRK